MTQLLSLNSLSNGACFQESGVERIIKDRALRLVQRWGHSEEIKQEPCPAGWNQETGGEILQPVRAALSL